ncbi:MAG: hypothetical protein BroJett011_74790 [Chloroflexota bacterium]|nr:MAG: hypothetical protein BroJett011_74790 [Chloroflexota bacterium]
MKNDDIATVLTLVGLSGLRVVADPDGIAALEGHPGGKYNFAEALRLALEAFLRNGRGSPDQGHDSAFDVVRSTPESFGLADQPAEAEITAALRNMLAGDPKAEIVLLTAATIKQDPYRFLPEYGESITENWVFRIIAPAAWPFLQWSIVDVRGEMPAYSYEFD